MSTSTITNVLLFLSIVAFVGYLLERFLTQCERYAAVLLIIGHAYLITGLVLRATQG